MIVFSIHQPRYSIFKLFDTVMLMCKGKNVFHGAGDSLIDYFSAHGYVCEQHDNPADFVLDILIESSRDLKELDKLNRLHEQSSIFIENKKMIDKLWNESTAKKSHLFAGATAARSVLTEIWYVSRRTLKNTLRDPALFLSQSIVAIILGLLVGLVYFDMKLTVDPGMQNRLGAIFFMVVSQVFSTVTALEPLLKERALFIHVRNENRILHF